MRLRRRPNISRRFGIFLMGAGSTGGTDDGTHSWDGRGNRSGHDDRYQGVSLSPVSWLFIEQHTCLASPGILSDDFRVSGAMHAWPRLACCLSIRGGSTYQSSGCLLGVRALRGTTDQSRLPLAPT